jgi:hypothetical protein
MVFRGISGSVMRASEGAPTLYFQNRVSIGTGTNIAIVDATIAMTTIRAHRN